MWKKLSDNYYSYMKDDSCLANLKRVKNGWLAEIIINEKWEIFDIPEMGLNTAKNKCLSIIEGV